MRWRKGGVAHLNKNSRKGGQPVGHTDLVAKRPRQKKCKEQAWRQEQHGEARGRGNASHPKVCVPVL